MIWGDIEVKFLSGQFLERVVEKQRERMVSRGEGRRGSRNNARGTYDK